MISAFRRLLTRVLKSGRRRRIGVVVIVATALAGALVLPTVSRADNTDGSGCDFAATGTTESCAPHLTGSSFAGADGNLLTNPTNFGTVDWQNVAGLNAGFDLPSGTSDNSFGQGTKEDNPGVTVVTGSIPNNKSDLTRFYEAADTGTVGGQLHNFLYLAFERNNALGTANMDFEINHDSQPDLTTKGAKTLSREAGDLLVTYDFTNGGGKPTIGILRWLTSTSVPVVPNVSTNVCFSANSFPCWGDQKTLDGTDSEAAVNNLDSVTDPLFSAKANYLNPVPVLQFGETAIDLTAAGVFQSGTCSALGSAFVKSRSSASFTAEAKDFIAPIPVNISNCGEVTIIKQTDPRGKDKAFSFTSTGGPSSTGLPATTSQPDPGGVVCPGTPTGTTNGIQSDGSFCLNDNGATSTTVSTPPSTVAGGNTDGNTVDNADVPAGTYTVTEGTEPNTYTFAGIACTDNGETGLVESVSGQAVTITLTPNGHVTCAFVNRLNSGAILITKSGKDKNCTARNTPTITNGVCTGAGTANLGGATFSVSATSGGTDVTGSPVTTSNTTGQACIDGLSWSSGNPPSVPAGTTYYVTETAAPAHYSIDNTSSVTVTVTQNAKCSDSNIASEAALDPVTDTPLTDLSVNVHSDLAGATNSSVSCVNHATSAPIGNSPQPSTGMGDPETVTANTTNSNALKPGTYTCTITVDP